MSYGLPASIGEAIAVRWRAARLLPRAGVVPVAAAGLCNVVLGLLPVAFILGTSVMLGRVPAAVTAGLDSPEWSAVVTAFLLAAAAYAGQQALAPVQVALGELIASRIDGRMFDRLMAAALRTPGIAPLEDQRLLDDLSEASYELEQGFQSPGKACAGLVHLVARVVQLVGYLLVIGLAFAWWAALGVAVVVMAFRYGQRGGLRRYSQIFPTVAGRRREFRYFRGLAMQSAAAKEIRVFGLREWLTERYRRAYLAWVEPVTPHRRRIMLRPFFWFTGFGLVVTAAVVMAVGAAGADGLTMTVLALVIQAVLGALRLGEFYPESDVQTQFGMNAYEKVLAYERGIDAHAGPATDHAGAAPPLAGEIRFVDVSFGYPGRPRPVLDGLDLTIPAGTCTAIVGLNGAGKTTLVKLLLRLYEPDRGRVVADGVDIGSYSVDSWRTRVAAVFQDFNRYETTAADNIGLGAVEQLRDRARIERAAATAGCLDTVAALPRGLDTPLAAHMTGGVDLSGGQWQRIALARALFRLSTSAAGSGLTGGVLVLDEPTASLDVRAEARFFDEFMSRTRGATTVLISHRFATVRHADRIVVLADGRVAEAGTHAELMRLDGRYARLFRLQAERFTEAEAAG